MRVFPHSEDTTSKGGNPTVIFLDAGHLSDDQMQKLAHASEHECGYVVSGPMLVKQEQSHRPYYTVTIRYWVPAHEMEMCGHATIGALWLMDSLGLFPYARDVTVSTKAGAFEAILPPLNGATNASQSHVKVAQPRGFANEVSPSDREDIAKALGVSVAQLGVVQNAATSRIKTLIELQDEATVDSLKPEQPRVRAVCESLNSTGLYPYAKISDTSFSARQFPKSSGYLEDPATGIAATSLICGLLHRGIVKAETVEPIRVRQGWAMGMPSEIDITLRRDHAGEVTGYWLRGAVGKMVVNDAVLDMLSSYGRSA
jgi:PhzF family phenazine biosynthesis protein